MSFYSSFPSTPPPPGLDPALPVAPKRPTFKPWVGEALSGIGDAVAALPYYGQQAAEELSPFDPGLVSDYADRMRKQLGWPGMATVQADSLPANLPPAPGVNGGSPIQQDPGHVNQWRTAHGLPGVGAQPAALPSELPPAPRDPRFADVLGYGNGVMNAESPAPESHLRYSMGGGPMQEYNPQGAHAPQIQGAGQAFGQHYTPASGGGTVSMMSGSPENDARATAGSRMDDLQQYQSERLAADPVALQRDLAGIQTGEAMKMEGLRMREAEQQRADAEVEWNQLVKQTTREVAGVESRFPNKQDPVYIHEMEALHDAAKERELHHYLKWGIKLPSGGGYADRIAGV